MHFGEFRTKIKLNSVKRPLTFGIEKAIFSMLPFLPDTKKRIDFICQNENKLIKKNS